MGSTDDSPDSSSGVEELINQTQNNPTFVDKLRNNPEETLDQFVLSPETREAFLQGDIQKIREVAEEEGFDPDAAVVVVIIVTDQANLTESLIRIGENVPEVDDEPWNLYWNEFKTDSDEFETFINNPVPILSNSIEEIDEDYHVTTTVMNHERGLAINIVCWVLMVMPEYKRAHALLYKH